MPNNKNTILQIQGKLAMQATGASCITELTVSWKPGWFKEKKTFMLTYLHIASQQDCVLTVGAIAQLGKYKTTSCFLQSL